MRSFKLFSGLLLAFCLANTGCTSLGGTSLVDWWNNGLKVGPNHCCTNEKIANEWRHNESEHLKDVVDDYPTWWNNIDDEANGDKLHGLIEHAFYENLGVKEAGARVLRAEALVRRNIGGLFPQSQTSNGGYNRVQTPGRVVGATFSQGFTASWEIDFWGKFRRNIEASQHDLLGTEANRQNVLICLYADIAQSYVAIRTFENQLRETEKNFASQSKKLASQKKLADQGVAGAVPGHANEIIKNETAAAIAEIEINLEKEKNKLAVLLGETPGDIERFIAVTEKDSYKHSKIPTLKKEIINIGTPYEAIRRRPDVLQAEQALAAQCSRVGVAISDLYPSISLAGNASWSGAALGSVFDANRFGGSISPSFRWNILNYGRLRNNIDAEKQRLQQLAFIFEQTVLLAQQDVQNAIIDFQINFKVKTYFENAEKAAEEAIKQIAPSPDQGLDKNAVANLSVYQSAKTTNKNNAIAANANVILNAIRLYKALGGGWKDSEGFPSSNDSYPATIQDALVE